MSAKDKIIKILAECSGKDLTEISEETSIVHDLQFDSLDLIELKMAFEEEFDIEISYDDFDNEKTLGDLISYLEEREVM